ncbi:hypothetical protein [Yoonia sp. R78084]|uniref:hypothetical protein n=1 Tax=Yoonia sp. R78084 TaxID=3093869 RepID=UPI0037DBF9EF
MFLNIKLCTSAALVALIAGCGGSGSVSQASYSGLQSELDGLFAEAGGAPLFLTDDLPVEGTSTYNGVISLLVYEDDLQVLGDLEVVADFELGNESVTASADSFSDNTGDTYQGRLEMPDGVIFFNSDPSDAGFTGDFGGTLTSNSTDEQIVVDTLLIGDFYGSDYEYVYGVLRGEITTSQGTLQINDGIDRNNVEVNNADGDVIFIAER